WPVDLPGKPITVRVPPDRDAAPRPRPPQAGAEHVQLELGVAWTIPNKTSDPRQALENLLARDALFTEEVRHQADALNLRYINVGNHLSVEDSVAQVGRVLGIGLGWAGLPFSSLLPERTCAC